MFIRPDRARLRAALAGVEELVQAAVSGSDAHGDVVEAVPNARRASAANLAHYLAVRSIDLRALQRELADLSLSSLGRMEGSVLATLHGLRDMLRAALADQGGEGDGTGTDAALSAREAAQLLDRSSIELLGPTPKGRWTRIMVTLPTEAATDRALLRSLLAQGADLVRINLAHDDPEQWTAMAQGVRDVARETGRDCRILADLPGPKLRTGSLAQGPRVQRVRPRRDCLGLVTEKAKVAFADPGQDSPAPATDEVAVPLVTPLSRITQLGDELVVIDTRQRQRRFRIRSIYGGVCHATISRTAYVGTDCAVELRRRDVVVARSRVGTLPPRPGYLSLAVGDLLDLTRSLEPGIGPSEDESGAPRPARVPCTLPEVFDAVAVGERVLIDDGKIRGEIVTCDGDEIRVRITATPPQGGRLRAEKGINLPDTDLHLGGLTAYDEGCLDWVVAHADLVGFSFVQRAADVPGLRAELQRRGGNQGIVLKIETEKAFARMPELLFAGLAAAPVGVMVARGDLAVEVGYERLAEVQEEILWLCEAAHVPVIWATQVLDSMARTGMPSRAEVTDAGMGARAECVMLNKGPYIAATVAFLGNVLERMQGHYAKKRSMLRRLRVAGGWLHPG